MSKQLDKYKNNLNQVDFDLIEERQKIMSDKSLSDKERLKKANEQFDKIMHNMIAKGLDVSMDEKLLYKMAIGTFEVEALTQLMKLKI